MTGARSSSETRCRHGRGCRRQDCRFSHPEGRKIDDDAARKSVYRRAQPVPVFFSPPPLSSPSLIPVVPSPAVSKQSDDINPFFNQERNPHCVGCEKEKTDHWYWDCPQQAEKIWEEKTLRFQKEYDLLIGILKKECVDKKRALILGSELFDIVKGKFSESGSLALAIERALIQRVLVNLNHKQNWKETTYSVSPKAIEEYLIPRSWPAVEERLTQMQDGETVIFVDGDNVDHKLYRRLNETLQDKKKTDFLMVIFFSDNHNTQQIVNPELTCVVHIKTLTLSKDAADTNLSMMAAIADKFLLPKGIPLFIMTRDRFASETLIFIKRMHSKRDIRWFNLYGYSRIIESEEIDFSQLGKELRNANQMELDFAKQCSTLVRLLYEAYVASGISVVKKYDLLKLAHSRGLYTQTSGKFHLFEWAQEKKLITVQKGANLLDLEVIISAEVVREYYENPQQVVVPQTMPLCDITDRFRGLTNERVIFMDHKNTNDFGAAMSAFQPLDRKSNILIVIFSNARLPAVLRESEFIILVETVTLGVAQSNNFSMMAAMANRLAPLTCTFSFITSLDFVHESIARLRKMQPKRVIEHIDLASFTNQMQEKNALPRDDLFLFRHKLHCFVCGREGAGHGYWECSHKGEPIWEEKTSAFRKEYDLLIGLLKEEFLDKNINRLFGGDLKLLIEKKFPEVNVRFSIERALLQAVLISEDKKWIESTLTINQEKVEEYLRSSVSIGLKRC